MYNNGTLQDDLFSNEIKNKSKCKDFQESWVRFA